MTHYKFHNDCQSSVLTYEQVKRLDFVMDQTVPIHGRGNFPTLYVKLKELIRLVKYKLQMEHSIEIRDVRLNGGAASYVLAPENSHYNDLDLIFGIDLSDEDQFDVIRDVVLDCLKEFHPNAHNHLHHHQQQQQQAEQQQQQQPYQMPLSNCAIKEAYVHKMVKVNDDDRWSLISLGVQQSEANCCNGQTNIPPLSSTVAAVTQTNSCSSLSATRTNYQYAVVAGQQQQSSVAATTTTCNSATTNSNNENEPKLSLINQKEEKKEEEVEGQLNAHNKTHEQQQQNQQQQPVGTADHQHQSSYQHQHQHQQQQNQRNHYQQQQQHHHHQQQQQQQHLQRHQQRPQKQFPNSIELKFVDRMRRKFEFSVDSFQIILDSLIQFYDYAPQPSTLTSQRKLVSWHPSSTMINTRPLISRRGRCCKCCSVSFTGANATENSSSKCGSNNNKSSVVGLSKTNRENIHHSQQENHHQHQQHQHHHNNHHHQDTHNHRQHQQLGRENTIDRFSATTTSESGRVLNSSRSYYQLHLDSEPLISSVASSSGCSSSSSVVSSSSSSLSCDEDHEDLLYWERKQQQDNDDDNDDLVVYDLCEFGTTLTTNNNHNNNNNSADNHNHNNNNNNNNNRTPCAVISENFYPTVIGRSEYGNFKEALYHLEKKLIATRSPEEIRGGGLLKYCNLLVKNYKPTNVYQIRTLERYMCSRFFIDFSDLNQQQAKLESYLANHFSDDPILKFDYLTILHNVVQRSTVCLMNHELRLTLNMIRDLAYKLNEYQLQHRQAAAAAAAAAVAAQMQSHSQHQHQQQVTLHNNNNTNHHHHHHHQQQQQKQASSGQTQQAQQQNQHQKPVLIQSGVYRVKLVMSHKYQQQQQQQQA